MSFDGFPPATLELLAGLGEHNDKAWFTAHRPLYDATVAAGKAFVEAVGPRLEAIAPEVRYEARIGASLPRINRDIRFSADKRPYKDHFDLWFWLGEEKSFDRPGFYMRITAEGVWIAAGMMHIRPPLLTRFRDAIVADRSGEAMVAAIAEVERAGAYQVGYASRKSVPRGYDKASPRAGYLLYEGLWSHLQLPPEAVLDGGLADRAVAAWQQMWPLNRWLLAEVVD